MKRILSLILMSFLLISCGNTTPPLEDDVDLSGTVTEDSKHFMDKGYYLGVYKEIQFPPEAYPEMDHYYVAFTYNIINEYTSDHIPNPSAGYNIKEIIVTNMQVTRQPTLGNADVLYGEYSMIEDTYIMVSANDTYVRVLTAPNTENQRTSVAVVVNKIVHITDDEFPDEMTFEDKYLAKGVTTENIQLTLSYRVELHTLAGDIFYQDYEYVLPPTDFDVSLVYFPELDFMIDNPAEYRPFKLK